MTRNERFADGHLSLETLLEGMDAAKSPLLSDNGREARRIRRAPYDKADLEEERAIERQAQLGLDNRRFVQLLLTEVCLELCKLERLIPVLEQIVLNGRNKQESIRNLAKIWHIKKASAERAYFRGSKELRTFISPNKIKGETHVEEPSCQ